MNLKFWTIDFYKKIGYSLTSSRYLAKRLVDISPLLDDTIIIELGAWEWQVTPYILAAKGENTRLISIELDTQKAEHLREKFWNRCEVTTMSAAHIGELVAPGSVDTIISTLPLWSISPEWVEHILRAIHEALKPGWIYIQYQYWMYNRRDISRHFTIEHTYWEPRNSVPAFIYLAKKSARNTPSAYIE